MKRAEPAKKLFAQARKMNLSLAASVIVYGAVGYHLIQMGKTGPAALNAQTYLLVKYGALAASVVGIWVMRKKSMRMIKELPGPIVVERRPQKLLAVTIVMCAAAELPVLLGMILIFLGHQPYDYIPFAIISLTGFVLAFPKKQLWSAWLGIQL